METAANSTGRGKSDDRTWKFFDPLASPTEDEELRRLEAVLDAKAKKANQGLILESRPDIIASTDPKRPERRSRAAPKDIESLISNNLLKLRSLSPSSSSPSERVVKATDEGSNLTYDRLDVAKSVLVELKGKTPPEKPPPILRKKAAPPPPPPAPPKPPKLSSAKRLAPERPPAPKVDLMDVNYVDEPINKKDIEPMYARVKKDTVRPDRLVLLRTLHYLQLHSIHFYVRLKTIQSEIRSPLPVMQLQNCFNEKLIR